MTAVACERYGDCLASLADKGCRVHLPAHVAGAALLGVGGGVPF